MGQIVCVDHSGRLFSISPDQLCSGFHEQGRYVFLIPEGAGQLFVDDVALAAGRHEQQMAWVWEPGFYAGEVAAELTDVSGNVVALYRLSVAPQGEKLEQASFERMIADIQAFDPSLLMGTEYTKSQIGVQGEVTNVHLQYARLRCYGDAFLKAMRRVTKSPLTRLRRERTIQGLNKVRRLDRYSVHKAMRNPAMLPVLNGQSSNFGTPGPIAFDVSTVFNDLDNAANQTLCAVLRAVARRAGQVIAGLSRLSEQKEQDGARSLLVPRLARRMAYLNRLQHDLRRIARSEPFTSIKTAHISSAGLNAISAHPLYASAYRVGWHALRNGVGGELSDERHWMSPTWEVYERWCYLQVVKTLQARYSHMVWQRDCVSNKAECIAFNAIAPNIELNVWLQVRCPAFDKKPNRGFASISRQRFPDIVITLEAHGQKRFLVLDAKYRASRYGVLDAMQSAHIYRDSLRWQYRGPDCTLLLVPKKGGVPSLETTQYRDTYGVGVVALGVGEDLNTLGELLHGLLGPAITSHTEVQ